MAYWHLRFERMSPVRGFASFWGQRNWPGWWWFSRTSTHAGYESWVERDVLMALDADPGVEAVASQPMWLHWADESGRPRRHAPDFFVRRADGTGVLIDVWPDLRQFKALTLSRLAAQHEEIHRLRAAASPPPGPDVRDLASRRAGT